MLHTCIPVDPLHLLRSPVLHLQLFTQITTILCNNYIQFILCFVECFPAVYLEYQLQWSFTWANGAPHLSDHILLYYDGLPKNTERFRLMPTSAIDNCPETQVWTRNWGTKTDLANENVIRCWVALRYSSGRITNGILVLRQHKSQNCNSIFDDLFQLTGRLQALTVLSKTK